MIKQVRIVPMSPTNPEDGRIEANISAALRGAERYGLDDVVPSESALPGFRFPVALAFFE